MSSNILFARSTSEANPVVSSSPGISASPGIQTSHVTVPIDDLIRVEKAVHRITSTLDLDELIDRVLAEVASAFELVEANVFLYNEERAELVVAAAPGCTLHEKGQPLKAGEEGMVGYVAATGQMRYAPDVREDQYYIACEESTMSEVAIPLQVEGRLVGVFTASHRELNAFSPRQLRLLQAWSNHIAIAVQNARRFQQERDERERMTQDAHEARAIQQSLLPRSSPYIPGFAISGLSVSAGAVGGDWYDFIPMDKGLWALVLADVSGKGTAAALLMSATRGILRSLAEACSSPRQILQRLNKLLVEDFPAGRFVTMVYAVLDPAKRTITFANAGHLEPLLIHEGKALFLSSADGMPLGLTQGEFSEVEVQLEPGMRMVFYSDGITEATNPDEEQEEYGFERMRQHLMHCETSPESLLDDVRSFANGYGLQDDATIISVKMME